jgi:hypothetical protein
MTDEGNDPITTALSGQFWLPGHPDRPLPGRLILSRGNIRVEVQGELTPALREVSRSEQPDGTVVVGSVMADDGPRNAFVVHGRLNESPHLVTLINCFTLSRQGSMFGNMSEEQHLRVRYAIRGAHLCGSDEQFTAFRVRFQNLDAWAALAGFSVTHTDGGGCSLAYQPVGITPVSLAAGGELSISSSMSMSWPTVRGGHIRRQLWLELSGIEKNWEELGRLITTPLFSLLTLSVGQDCSPLEYKVKTQEGEWVSVLVGSIPPDGAELKPNEIMVSLADISLQGVATWLDKAATIGPLPPVVANAVGASSLRVETQLLELTTVAEGLHSRLFPDDRRMETELANQMREKVSAAIGDEDQRHQQIVNSLLAYLEEPGYTARLSRLAQEVSEALPGITGKTKKWVAAVSDCRNSFAHRRAGFVVGDDVDRYYGVIVSLRWVLVGVLLLQTGIDPCLLSNRVEEDSSFTHFRRQAAQLLPKVYDASE